MDDSNSELNPDKPNPSDSGGSQDCAEKDVSRMGKVKPTKLPKSFKGTVDKDALKGLAEQIKALDEAPITDKNSRAAVPIGDTSPAESTDSGTGRLSLSPTVRASLLHLVKKASNAGPSAGMPAIAANCDQTGSGSSLEQSQASSGEALSKSSEISDEGRFANEPVSSEAGSPAADKIDLELRQLLDSDDESDLLPNHLVPEGNAPSGQSECGVEVASEQPIELNARKDSSPTKLLIDDGAPDAIVAAANASSILEEEPVTAIVEHQDELEAVSASESSIEKVAKDFKRTKLDPEALRDLALQLKAEEDERLRQELEVRSEPAVIKPQFPIQEFRKASACPVKWEQMSGGESRVKYCDRCRQQVYDLNGLSEEHAKELLIQREGRSDLDYYRRTDGKYQVQDCPVGVAKKRQLPLLVCAVIAVLVVLVWLMINNKPVTQQSVTVPDASQGSGVDSATPSQSPYSTAPPAASTAPLMPAAQPPASGGFSEPVVAPDSSTKSPTSEVEEVELGDTPVQDANGVMSHPYVNRQVTPAGGYPSPGQMSDSDQQ